MLDLARTGRITAIASWRLAEEIVEVLRRPRLRRYRLDERDVADVLTVLAPLLPDVDIDVDLRDVDDAPVVEAAIAGGADVIVTGDRDLLDDDALRRWLGRRGIELLTPAELVARA